jgi:flagellar motor switch protein FliN/FliY
MQTFNIEALADVRVTLSALLGHADASLREILEFRPGTIIPLHVAAGSPVPLLVNGIAVADGEIVTLENGALAMEILNIALPPELQYDHE